MLVIHARSISLAAGEVQTCTLFQALVWCAGCDVQPMDMLAALSASSQLRLATYR